MEQHKNLQIPLKEIASNTFHKENYLGGGGFGAVYKGELSRFKERGMVAFKKLDRIYGQGETEFFKEIEMLSQYKHENIITLLGYCMEGKELILVYEYASNGSLDSRLGSPHLTWILRLKICLQAAKGLRYLHGSNESHLRVIHRDIKSANILLDDEWNAKVSDFGLSKISPENANLVTYNTGTAGYSDPQYYRTYTLTEKSDVYSFGVTLFEVLCGRLCYDITGYNELTVLVHMWMKSYEQNKIEDIIFKELDMKQIDVSSLKSFSEIAYKCLNESREERPSMAEVVTELEVALQAQQDYDMILQDPDPLAKKYIEIVRTAVSPVKYRSIEELKERLSEGVLVNGGKTWLSLNDKGENHVMISIEDYLILDDPQRDTNWSKEKSRFAVGCYKTRLMEFKLRVTAPLLLSPDVAYGLNLVLHASEIDGTKPQYVGFRYKIQGETKISIMHFADKKEGKQLVAELYQFNSTEESILDLEIFLEDSGLSGNFYIEGIEFHPLEEVERQVIIANQEIVRGMVFYRFTEESKVFLSQGVLLNGGKTWLSLNDKEEHHVIVSIEEYLSLDDPNRDYSDRYLSTEKSRLAVGCYTTSLMEFKLRVTSPLFLSPDVTYGLNLLFHSSEIEGMKQQYVGFRYKIQGETKISIMHFEEKKEGKQLVVAELYQFTSTEESILDLQIFLEDCGLSGDLYIEGIEFRPLEEVERQVVIANQEIVRGVVPPLLYRFTEESKVLLSQGVLLNGGKTMLSITEKGEHIERIYIQSCLNPDEIKPRHLQHLSDDIVNSRFPGGICYHYYLDFKASVRGEYLTPHISYTLNLIFRYEDESDVNSYNPLRYKIDGEAKVFIIYPSIHEREDGWFIAPLYHFTTQHPTADLQFRFEIRGHSLLVAGFEFQPSEEKVELQVFEEYQDIVEAATQSLFYTSLDELKQILTKGVLLNGYKTWFTLNEKGEHCHMISMEDCLIPNEDSTPRYESHWCSRFPAGFYQTNSKGFKTHVKTQFLSPSVTYTVNLVYYSSSGREQVYVDLKYRLKGEATTSAVYHANQRQDDELHMVELYQFISDGSIVDLEIIFENSGTNIEGVEGIMFQPLEKVEDQLLEDNRVEDIEAISDSDTYLEQKIPNDYEETLKLSKVSLEWKTKKELYSILCKGFLLDNGQQWFGVDKNGKKCRMLSARAAVVDNNNSKWESSNESRFGEVLVITAGDKFKVKGEIKSELVLLETTYAAYLVFKLPQDQSTFEVPILVEDEKVDYYSRYPWLIYLVSPSHTPVIGPKFDENSCNPLNRYKGTAIPQQRSDGWMEVKVSEFQTDNKTVYMNLRFEHPGEKNLKGLMVQGIELRPI